MKKKVTVLEGLKVREVSFVKKGANGEMFEIIKSADTSPSDILKEMMQDPKFQDETDVEIAKEMGDGYAEYCNDFVDSFVSDIQKQGEDVDSFLNEVIQEKLNKSCGDGKGKKKDDGDPEDKIDGGVDEDEEDKTGKKKVKKEADEEEIVKGFLGNFTDTVKNLFGKNSKIEKGYMQEYSNNTMTDADRQAQYYGNCCESVLYNTLQAIQTITNYGANKKLKDTIQQLFDIASTVNEQCISVQKSDSGDEDVTKMNFDISKIKKMFGDFSEITGVEKEDDDMDIKKALEDAMKPITESITSISARVQKMEAGEVKKADDSNSGESEITKSIKEALEPVVKSLGDITERIDKVEKTAMPSGKLEGQDKVEKGADSKKWGSFSVGK